MLDWSGSDLSRGTTLRRDSGDPGLDAGRSPALFFLLILAFVSAGCARQASGGQDAPAPVRGNAPAVESDRPGSETASPIAVAEPLSAQAEVRRYSIDTSLIVDEDVDVMARMGGVVEKIFVERGSRVKKGEPLLRLINRDLKLLLRRAEIVARQRQADFERARELFTEKAISAAEFEQIDLARESAAVDVDIAREELEKSIVRAPFDGVVSDRFARPGQRIIEDDAEPLFRVTALSPLLARLFLPEEIARSVRAGDVVEVTPRFAPSAPVDGIIEWVSSVVDASSGTRQAIVTLPGGGENGLLSPGVSVSVSLDLADAGGGVLIPRAALDGRMEDPGSGIARVRVVEDGNGAWRKVRVGSIRGDRVEILDGLRPGERVVLLGDAEDGAGAAP